VVRLRIINNKNVIMNKNTDMQQLEIYHNRRCSKSNQALNYLKSLGWTDENLKVILYLEQGLKEAQIINILERLQDDISELIRLQDAKKMGIEIPKQMDRAWILQKLVENPKIMQRPIIVYKNKAIIARSIEKIDSLFP